MRYFHWVIFSISNKMLVTFEGNTLMRLRRSYILLQQMSVQLCLFRSDSSPGLNTKDGKYLLIVKLSLCFYANCLLNSVVAIAQVVYEFFSFLVVTAVKRAQHIPLPCFVRTYTCHLFHFHIYNLVYIVGNSYKNSCIVIGPAILCTSMYGK